MQAAFQASRVSYSTKPSQKTILAAHIIASLTLAESPTDESINFPSAFPSRSENKDPPFTSDTSASSNGSSMKPETSLIPPPPRTDQPFPTSNYYGRTITIHSIAVLPPYQNLGLGSILLNGYLQRMENSGIADRIVLLARPGMVDWFVRNFGFQDKGDSDGAQKAGHWRELVSFHGSLYGNF